MFKYSFLLSIFLILSFLFSRTFPVYNLQENSPDHSDNNIKYSFFVAGHVYGAPGNPNRIGVHPPFKNDFPNINKIPTMKFGVLAGDSVMTSRDKEYNDLNKDLSILEVPVHMVPGNHELTTEKSIKNFEKFYKNRYFSWKTENDLHIALDSIENGWNIKGKQLSFLKEALSSNLNVNNVFIYTHNVIWWNKEIHHRKIFVNSFWGRDAKSNFWTEIIPLLVKTNKKIYLFAGDVGVQTNLTSAYFQKIGNIHFIATGMGGNKKDNYIISHVLEDSTVSFELISLNSNNRNQLGALEEQGFIVKD